MRHAAKDFDGWNVKKQQLEMRDASKLYFRTREVWFCSIGVNIGFEEDGKHSEFERLQRYLYTVDNRQFKLLRAAVKSLA